MKNLTFILGGARSGKSTYAEQLAKETGEPVLYAATAEVLDDEMRERVRQHRLRRPETWGTVECPHDAADAIRAELRKTHYSCVLLDCLSILASNTLLDLPEESTEAVIYETFFRKELLPLLTLIRDHPDTRFIIVSNEVGMGVVPATSLGRKYRDFLGRANQCIAASADFFYFTLAGVPIPIKSL